MGQAPYGTSLLRRHVFGLALRGQAVSTSCSGQNERRYDKSLKKRRCLDQAEDVVNIRENTNSESFVPCASACGVICQVTRRRMYYFLSNFFFDFFSSAFSRAYLRERVLCIRLAHCTCVHIPCYHCQIPCSSVHEATVTRLTNPNYEWVPPSANDSAYSYLL